MNGSITFASFLGPPAAGTGLSDDGVGLQGSSTLRAWAEAGHAGVYRGGLLSLCSARENGGRLGGWARYVPAGARLFASSAFGFLYVTTGEDLWVVDPHNGLVTESDIPLAELPDVMSDAEVREQFLREELFELWRELSAEDLLDQWLCPSPAIPLGGDWTLASMQKMAPEAFLSFSVGLFPDSGPDGVVVQRL